MAQSGFLMGMTISLMLAACGASVAHADEIYGVESSGYLDFMNLFPDQSWDTGSNPVAVTTYTSPVLYGTGSNPDGTLFGSGTSSTSASGGALHGFASDNVTCATGCYAAGTYGIGGEYQTFWYDTLFVVGLPAGTPVEIMLTTTLDSTITISSESTAFVYASATINGDYQAQVTNNGANNGSISQSVIIDTVAYAPLELESELEGVANAQVTGGGSAYAVADASDTENTYITILTPGATYTTASGVSYSAVPEPSTLLLLGGLLPVIWVRARRRNAME